MYTTEHRMPQTFKIRNAYFEHIDSEWKLKSTAKPKFDSIVGQGAYGLVLSGDWCGKKAAFKFIEIGTNKFRESTGNDLKNQNDRLSELSSIQATNGSKILDFYGHYRLIETQICFHIGSSNSQLHFFRQKVQTNEDQGLLKLIGHENMEGKKYDVMVTELCDGNLKKEGTAFTLTQSIDICKQLLEGLQQLEKSKTCHNDLKPANILYKTKDATYENGDQRIEIKIGDFGTANRSGGTPGWTWPKFMSERKPGRSDMYSIGLLVLYIMCETSNLFYRLRDNYIEPGVEWVAELRQDPLIELVLDMIGLNLSTEECRTRWDDISDFEFLTETHLCMDYRIPHFWFDIQDGLNNIAFGLTQLDT